MEHGTAPHQRLVARIQKTDGDDLYSIALQRLNAVLTQDAGLHVGVHHERHVGAIHIAVEQARTVTHLSQRYCEIHSDGGFAYSAFARTDSDNAVDARQGRWTRLLRRSM